VDLQPLSGSLNVDGLDIDPATLTNLLAVDRDAVRAELPQVREHLEQFGDRLPAAVRAELERLESALG